MRKLDRTTAAKVLASTALVAGAAGVAGLGTFGAFTSTTTASQDVASGTVRIAADKSGELSAAVSGLVPGDVLDRTITLSNAGSEKLGNVYLTAATTGDQVLFDASAANSLRLSVDSCPTAWTPRAAGSAELACAGGATSVVGSKPVTTANLDLPALTAQLNGATKSSNLRVRLALPYNAAADDNALQGKAASVKLTFDATQRAGEAR